jgi:hypothetical protein
MPNHVTLDANVLPLPYNEIRKKEELKKHTEK